jgi:putative transposase
VGPVRSLLVAFGGSQVLWSFAYLMLCRPFELAVLLCRSERAKELEILVLRYELVILRRQASWPQAR